MSIDFREQAGGRSGKTEGLLERQATLGKTRYEALRASNPLASLSLLRNLPIQEICSHDPPKGGENDGSIGDNSMLTGTAQRTMRLRTLNVGLEMDYPCICGRRFASERGMKIHRTKMGCLNKSFQQQRTALADKTSENQSRAQNHSAKEIQAEDQDEELRQLINAKRQKINFPAATAVEQWEDLDSKIVLKLDSLIRDSTLEHKLATFGDIVYQTSLETFGAKQYQSKGPPKRSRRQCEMDKLPLSRAESARKKRSQKRKNQERFLRDPFQFARQLFQKPKSGTLAVSREDLEAHLKETYSDTNRELPLEETAGLIWPAAPGIKFNNKPPNLQEVVEVVNKARAKSAPGPNGVPYLLYKRCSNVLMRLHKILRSAWNNIKVSKEWMTAEGV
ncbi:reverse transcriptase [Elysia marginata]|uniref:Reverse transcriptase n=1 Tax=Elysia marginata TaxID=1093978 RepID=A0AAV4GPG8_9GAST|nr:reverse transcriptase [Elysia marginata]